MRFTISPEQFKFFQTKGYLEIENLLEEKEVFALKAEIDAVKLKSPGYPEENLFRSIPLISTLIKKNGWGQLSADLMHKRPLRLSNDKFFTSLPLSTEPLDRDSCGLFIDLTTRRGCFFRDFNLIKNLYNSSPNCYFLVILTAKFLPNQLHPIIVK